MENIVDDIMENRSLIEDSKFPKEVAKRFTQLLEDELQNPRNQTEIVDPHQREVFAVYSAIIKISCQFSGCDDSKLLAIHTEALKVAKQIREYEANEAASKIIKPDEKK